MKHSFSHEYQLLVLAVIIFCVDRSLAAVLLCDRDLQTRETDHRNMNKPEKKKQKILLKISTFNSSNEWITDWLTLQGVEDCEDIDSA